MKLTIDTSARTLVSEENGVSESHELYTKESFDLLSRQWLRVGWALRQYLTFTWLGQPIVQLPEDLVRLQEVVHHMRPEMIIETGIYQGGSLLFHATLCETLNCGQVVGIDVQIAPAVRKSLEDHPLSHRIRLIEGDSAAPEIIEQVSTLASQAHSVLVILDSDHSKHHVLRELEAYCRFVTPGSYIIVTDGFVRDLADVPGGQPEWAADNPLTAVEEFLDSHTEFKQEQPRWALEESGLTGNVTYWPDGWLKRLG